MADKSCYLRVYIKELSSSLQPVSFVRPPRILILSFLLRMPSDAKTCLKIENRKPPIQNLRPVERVLADHKEVLRARQAANAIGEMLDT
jgi:hypothetical protein